MKAMETRDGIRSLCCCSNFAPEILNDQQNNHRYGETTAYILQPLQPIEEVEGLERVEENDENEHTDGRISHKLAYAQRAHRRPKIFRTVAGHEEFKQIGLQETDKRHRTSSHTRRVRENVDAKSHDETQRDDRPTRVSTSEQQHQVDIEHRRGKVEKVDVVQHKRLCQDENGKSHNALH